MRFCKNCHSLMIGEEASQVVPNLENLLKSHGFTPKNSSEIALLMAPICKRCIQELHEGLIPGTHFSLDRQAETSRIMPIKLEIRIQGEILQVRDNHSTSSWSQIYPGRVFRTQGESFTYDELRGMGNGTHPVKPTKPKK